MEVTHLHYSQIESASEILAHAFNNDPTFRYFSREEERARMNAIKCFAKAVLRYSQPYNQIYTTTNDLKGIAIWIPPGKFPLNDFRLLSYGFEIVRSDSLLAGNLKLWTMKREPLNQLSK